MTKIIDISTGGLRHSVTRSVTKKRTTFWQMIRCIGKLEYKPSLMTLLVVLAAIAYIFTPLSLFSSQPLAIRFLDDLFVLFIVLKVLSHETHRFTRFKARNRRACCND